MDKDEFDLLSKIYKGEDIEDDIVWGDNKLKKSSFPLEKHPARKTKLSADTIEENDIVIIHNPHSSNSYQITVGDLLRGMIRIKKENPDKF